MQPAALQRTSCLLLAMATLWTTSAAADEPEWVTKRPNIPLYYIGIGVVRKDRAREEYTGAARNVALNDIAGQITVSVSSDVLRTVLEKNEQLEDEFQSRIRASATADLEGIQVVDTYETDDEYWIYCRLSKADYEERRAEKLNAAVSQAVDLYSRGKTNEQKGNTGQAIGFYAQAFVPIEKYLAEPLKEEGRSEYLVNDIYSSLRTLLERIDLKTTEGEVSGKIGRPLKKPLEVRAIMKDSATPAAGLPFRFAFTRGSGEHVDFVKTDDAGIARCPVQKITATDRIQVVGATLDLLALAGGEQAPPVVRTVLSSFTPPATRFVLNVSGVDVFVESDESMYGQRLKQNRIEPVLKSELGEKNFSFVDDRSRASLIISIKADVRKGSESYGLAFGFASATVSVLDLETGQEIYKGSVTDVKEGSDSFEKAGFKALNTAAQRMAAELVPKLVEKVQR